MQESEAELVERCLRIGAARLIVRGMNYVVLREQRTTYGRPDLLVVALDAATLAKRASDTRQAPPFGKIGALAQAYLAHTRWIGVEALARYLRITVKHAEAVSTDLELRGLVLRNGSNVRARRLADTLVVRRVTAVEAKLHAWKSAIAQATRHLWFADASYVLLGAVRTTTREIVAGGCRERGLGLIVSERAGPPRLVVPSPRRRVPLTWFTWFLNEQVVCSAAETVGSDV